MSTQIPSEKIKVNAGGRFRRGRILAVGHNRRTKERMVKVTIDYQELPWGSALYQTDWYPVTALRKQDQALLEQLRAVSQ